MKPRPMITVKMTETNLRQRNQYIAMLSQSANELALCDTLQEVLKKGLDQFLENFPVDAGRLYLMDENYQGLTLSVWRNIDPTGLERIEMGQGFASKAVNSRQLVAQYISELPDSKRVELLTEKGFQVVICLPLMCLDQVVGVVNLTCTSDCRLDHMIIDMMILFGQRLAMLVANARLVEELKNQTHELTEQKEALQFFAYTAFHDLKSPTVGILGLTQRLQKKFASQLGDNGAEYCSQILSAASRVETLVQELNYYIKARKSSMEKVKVNLGGLLESLAQDFRQRLCERGVTLSWDADLPQVNANRLSLTRIFQNLVDNAIMHGGPEMSTIHISAQGRPGECRLQVTNDGVSIPADEAVGLFEPFQQRSISREADGTGLGLAIVKEVVDRHGGEIWVETPEDGGVSFCFILPDY